MIQYKSDTEALNDFLAKYNALRSEIGKVIVGQDEIVKTLLIAIFSRGHALLVGVALPTSITSAHPILSGHLLLH